VGAAFHGLSRSKSGRCRKPLRRLIQLWGPHQARAVRHSTADSIETPALKAAEANGSHGQKAQRPRSNAAARPPQTTRGRSADALPGSGPCCAPRCGVRFPAGAAQAVAMAEAVAAPARFITPRRRSTRDRQARLPLEVGAQERPSAGAVPERWQLHNPGSPALPSGSHCWPGAIHPSEQ